MSAYSAAFRVLIPENLRLQRPVQRQNRPAEPLTADRERNRLRAGAGVPIVKDNAVAVLTATALPTDQSVRLFPLCGVMRLREPSGLRSMGGSRLYGFSLMCFLHFAFRCRSPRKGFLPHSCGVFQRWHAPRTSGHFVPKWLLAVLPLPGYSFSDGHSFFKVQLIDELP